jgi:hypothetical protein
MSRLSWYLAFVVCAGAVSPALADPYGIYELTPAWQTALEAYQRAGSHQTGHTAYSTDGLAYLDVNGTTTALGAPLRNLGGDMVTGYVDVFGLDGADNVYGVGSRALTSSCPMCNSLWEWTGSEWTALGTADIFYSAGQQGGPPTVNYGGWIAGSWGYGAAYIWHDGSFVDLNTSIFSNVLSNDINNSNQALFHIGGDLPGTYGYLFYSDGQAQWIADLVSAASGWDLAQAENVQLLESGYLVGSAPYNGIETQFVLGPGISPVPEPASLSLFAAGALAGIAVWWRRRGKVSC